MRARPCVASLRLVHIYDVPATSFFYGDLTSVSLSEARNNTLSMADVECACSLSMSDRLCFRIAFIVEVCSFTAFTHPRACFGQRTVVMRGSRLMHDVAIVKYAG